MDTLGTVLRKETSRLLPYEGAIQFSGALFGTRPNKNTAHSFTCEVKKEATIVRDRKRVDTSTMHRRKTVLHKLRYTAADIDNNRGDCMHSSRASVPESVWCKVQQKAEQSRAYQNDENRIRRREGQRSLQ